MRIQISGLALALVLFLAGLGTGFSKDIPKDSVKDSVMLTAGSKDSDDRQDSLKNTLVLGLAASNNSYFFGRSTETKYPYLTTDVTYKFRSGIWFSAALFNIFNTASVVDETDLSAGYNFSFTDRLSGSLSYARYIYGPDNPLIKSAVSNIATSNLGLDWSYLYTSLTTSYIFGGSNDIFISLNNSRYFEKKGLLAAADYLGIEPAANLLWGTQTFTQTYTNSRNDNQPVKSRNPKAPTSSVTTTTETQFSLLNYGFTLPVTYGYKNSALELSWRFLVPVNAPAEYNTRPQSFFTITFLQVFQN